MKMGPGRREAPLSAVRLRIRSSVNVSKPKIDGSCEPSLLLAFYSRRAHGLWSPRFIVSVGPTVRIISVHRLNSSRFALPTRPLYYRPVPPRLRVRWGLGSRLTQMSVIRSFTNLASFDLLQF